MKESAPGFAVAIVLALGVQTPSLVFYVCIEGIFVSGCHCVKQRSFNFSGRDAHFACATGIMDMQGPQKNRLSILKMVSTKSSLL